MVFGPTLLLIKNKKKKQPERKIKNKRKDGPFQRNLGTSPPLELMQRLPAGSPPTNACTTLKGTNLRKSQTCTL